MTEGDWPRAPLPWQGDGWSQLVRARERGQLPHALLLTGAGGTGKLHFASALAALLLCDSPRDGTPCGECRSCHLVAVGNHGDLLQVMPEEKSRVIKIDQVRSLIDFAGKTAALGQHKVILLAPAESLNVNAANALLKCLEEPAANTHLLLVSHRPSALPATVRSRCQVLALAAPDDEVATNWLESICGSRDTAQTLLQAADGRPLPARDLYLADGLDARLALDKALDALAAGKLSPIDFTPLVTELELAEVYTLFIEFLQGRIRRQALEARPAGRESFLVLDDWWRLRAAVAAGGNPNRQLAIEDIAAGLGRVL